ncbi:SMI1/KNR4 family protein [Aureivirga sp. CE67]|uniref:SMI1/KNR4 family protein n=1 Tax=Aureivirga sp. CE67 TaxID=1788983 RepID=UPI0018CAEF63|nr:SMI1/KNR4 family protein [Aureivirga sp. CE67]
MEIIEKIVSLVEKSKNNPDCSYNVSATINPPASEEKIEKLEKLIGHSLPKDLKNIYKKCSGFQIEFSHKKFGFGSPKIKITSLEDNLKMYENRKDYSAFLADLKENQSFLILYQEQPELSYGYLVDENSNGTDIHTYNLEEYKNEGDTASSILNNILDRVAYYSN